MRHLTRLPLCFLPPLLGSLTLVAKKVGMQAELLCGSKLCAMQQSDRADCLLALQPGLLSATIVCTPGNAGLFKDAFKEAYFSVPQRQHAGLLMCGIWQLCITSSYYCTGMGSL